MNWINKVKERVNIKLDDKYEQDILSHENDEKYI